MKKIAFKFNFLLILSVAISVIVSSLATTTYLLYTSEKQTLEKDIIQVKGLADNIETFLAYTASLNYQLSIHPAVIAEISNAETDWELRKSSYESSYDTSGSFNQKSGHPLLVAMQEKYSFVELFFVQDALGDQVARSFGNIGRRSERWWFKQFTADGKYRPFISKSYYSLTGNIPVASVFHPILAEDRFLGIMGTDINFQHLQEIVQGYLKADDMYAIVLDSEGVIIAHPDTTKISELYNLVTMTRHVLKGDDNETAQSGSGYHETEEVALEWEKEIAESSASAIQGKGSYLKQTVVDSMKSALYFEPIRLPDTGNSQGYFAVILVHDTTAVVTAKKVIFLATSIFVLLVITILFLLFRSRFRILILTPLQILIESMKSLELDEFSPIVLQRDDEFSILVETYNDLVQRLSLANKELNLKMMKIRESEAGYKAFADIGVVLSTEKDIDALLELILDEARTLSRADGGTLYVYDDEHKHLKFEILHNETMNIRQGGTSGVPCEFPAVPLYLDDEPNYKNVSSYSALTGELINIADVYHAKGFDFEGMRKYDKRNGYKSQSMMVIPMKNREQELIGVIQLINSRKKNSDEIVPFQKEFERLLTSLAAQAAVSLTNRQLHKDLEKLLYSFIEGIAAAVDAKSPYTGGHINRVVTLTMMIADKINTTGVGAFKDVQFSENELEELRLAALMHDIGKVSTPESLMDKSTKLQHITDGTALIENRFRLIGQIYKNEHLAGKLSQEEYENSIAELENDLAFILFCNDSNSNIEEKEDERLKQIAEKKYTDSDTPRPFLTNEELTDLSIQTGTLNDRERKVMENHVSLTKKILEPLPFPRHVSRVSDYAAMHHEKLNGKGYHQGLKETEIPLQARIIAVSDIFEALTAKDRPYRGPLSFSSAIEILETMKKARHIDPDIYELIVDGGIGEEYAEKELT